MTLPSRSGEIGAVDVERRLLFGVELTRRADDLNGDVAASEAAGGSVLAALASPAASSALERALARLAAEAERSSGAADLVASRLDREWNERFAIALEAALTGREVSARDLPPVTPFRRLASAVRSSLIDELANVRDSVGAAGVAAALRAVEALEAAAERDGSRRFAAQLSGPDAMQLVVAVAHDMRSPLTAILFLVDVLRRVGASLLPPGYQRQLLLVHSAAFALCALARDVVDLASHGTGLIEPEPRAFSIPECLRNLEDAVAPLAEEKGLALAIDTPAAGARMGQPVALGRVLLNLVTNALKFTESGTVRVTSRALPHSRVEFAVEDTGPGIPAEVLSTLFDAFRMRERTRGYVFSSAGLGLSICQTLVSAMGGELQVSSTVGKGTRFSFELELPAANSPL